MKHSSYYPHSFFVGLCWISLLILCIVVVIGLYGYHSGSCKIQKKYTCTDDFCLYKEFSIFLSQPIQSEIHEMLENNKIQKRVEIQMFPETILNCAVPNKSGVTISTRHVLDYAPELIHYYKHELCKKISNEIGMPLFPTDLRFPTSCAILIYEKEGDWINWHYDYNYYDGRFFTVLIPITNDVTCTEFQFKNDHDEIKSIHLLNHNSVCFEGNYLYHRATKLCKGQKRVILSCQYVTNNNMNWMNRLRIQLKDFAYTGYK